MPWKIFRPLFSPFGLVLAVFLLRSDKGKKALRGAAKNCIRAGYIVKEGSGRLLTEAKEQVMGIVEEARLERNGHEPEQTAATSREKTDQ